MYCAKCGNPNNKMLSSCFEQDGNTVYLKFAGICEKCGEFIGIKEIFKRIDYDFLSQKEIKKILDK